MYKSCRSFAVNVQTIKEMAVIIQNIDPSIKKEMITRKDWK